MPTTRETVLAALHARLQPLSARTLRDEVLPERIPAVGLIILRDGQPGEPEVTLSPLRYHYQHRAELEVVDPPRRRSLLDGDPRHAHVCGTCITARGCEKLILRIQ
jgi:hypothetical protein